MKRLFKMFACLSVVLAVTACQQDEGASQVEQVAQSKKPKIAFAGIAIESSTFSPAQSHEEAFHVKIGDEIFDVYEFMGKLKPLRTRADWVPTLKGKSVPGGITTREAYESMVKKTLTMLEADLPYDGVFLDLHGAMSVVGLDDPEGDFIKRVREVVGDEPLISTSMDLHGNVSPTLARESDFITAYRMAPHEDALESRQRAIDNLITRLEQGKGRPAYKAWIPVPILLPGEKTSTRIEPAKSLYAKVAPTAAKAGVVDAAIWVGYPWADEPRNHAVVMVVGDDKEQVTTSAEEIAEYFWSVRNEFDFVAPVATLAESLNMALASDKRPYIISDTGDNPTAGGAGDVTWTLHELLKRPEFKAADGPSLIYASIPGPDFAKKALEIGVGGEIEGFAGADVDDRYAPPVKLKGKITAIREGDRDAGVEVVVRVGSMSVIVTGKRKPYHHEKDFTDLNLDPHQADIVMVKIGYLVPELYNMRADWVMALTPGGVDQNLLRMGHKRIQRPMFPFDPDMAKPNLKARLIPLSHEG